MSGLTKFGNMTGGDGLAGIFDSNAGTYGYSETTDGYAGAVLSEPVPIFDAQIDSTDNGFDASGLTSQITIDLYGKSTAGTPSSATDGTLLATTTFTDINAGITKTLVSSDNLTKFYSVWFRIRTGVWAIAREMRFYKNVVGAQVIFFS
jgi:hypothetical protein